MPARKAKQVVPKRRARAAAQESCFVIMPISDQDGYPSGHFDRVFEDIFVPACDKAGYKAVRADQIRETNLIHLDVLQRLLESPIALCDLSSRNPNVLFELGLRQAFDKPVVLVQETGTEAIFDIAPLRYTEYRKARTYHEVIADQEVIAAAITATVDAWNNSQGVNSLVKILALSKAASLPEVKDADRDPTLQLIRAELSALRADLHNLEFSARRAVRGRGIADFPPNKVERLLRYLSPRDAKIYKLITGLEGGREHTPAEVGAMLGLPVQDVMSSWTFGRARLQEAAMGKLR